MIDDRARGRDLQRRRCRVAGELGSDRLTQRGQVPADGDLDALAPLDEVREEMLPEAGAVETRERVVGDQPRERSRRRRGDGRCLRIDRQREDGKIERRQGLEPRTGAVAGPAQEDDGARVWSRLLEPHGVDRLERRGRFERDVIAFVAGEQERAQFGDQRGIAAEQETERALGVDQRRTRCCAAPHEP